MIFRSKENESVSKIDDRIAIKFQDKGKQKN